MSSSTQQTANKRINQNVGYVGSQASFEAVAPGSDNRRKGNSGQGPKVMTRDQVMKDPILGMDGRDDQGGGEAKAKIRSLAKKGHELINRPRCPCIRQAGCSIQNRYRAGSRCRSGFDA